jgi:preprotein translocase subunit SecF
MLQFTQLYKIYKNQLLLLLITILCIVLYIKLFYNKDIIENYSNNDGDNMELSIDSIVTEKYYKDKLNEAIEKIDLSDYVKTSDVNVIINNAKEDIENNISNMCLDEDNIDKKINDILNSTQMTNEIQTRVNAKIASFVSN